MMRFHPLCVFASACLVLSLAGCGESNPVVSYLKSTWGISITGFTGDLEVAGDGTQRYEGTGRITVEGLGTKELRSTTLVSPMAQGGDVQAVVSNAKTADGTGLIISSSRAILYASGGDDYVDAAANAARDLRDEINRYRWAAMRATARCSAGRAAGRGARPRSLS